MAIMIAAPPPACSRKTSVIVAEERLRQAHAWVAEAHCINDSGGNGKVGHAVIIDANSTTNNVEFSLAIYPSFPNQPTAG